MKYGRLDESKVLNTREVSRNLEKGTINLWFLKGYFGSRDVKSKGGADVP